MTEHYGATPIETKEWSGPPPHWAATLAGWRAGDFIGRGPTEQEAIADLRRKLDKLT